MYICIMYIYMYISLYMYRVLSFGLRLGGMYCIRMHRYYTPSFPTNHQYVKWTLKQTG